MNVESESTNDLYPTELSDPGQSTGRKIRHYFFEFLMLFLAITLGFFAENQRESYTERQLEVQFVTSMIDDLKKDTLQFNKAFKERKAIISMCDSLTYLFKKSEKTPHDLQRMYYMSRLVIFYNNIFFSINDRTYDQMRSSGNLRLIQNNEISNSISSYYFRTKELAVASSHGVLRSQLSIELEGKIFDGAVFNEMVDMEKFGFTAPAGKPLLITEDKGVINEFIINLHYVASLSAYNINFMKDMNPRASKLISVLRDEYQIE